MNMMLLIDRKGGRKGKTEMVKHQQAYPVFRVCFDQLKKVNVN